MHVSNWHGFSQSSNIDLLTMSNDSRLDWMYSPACRLLRKAERVL